MEISQDLWDVGNLKPCNYLTQRLEVSPGGTVVAVLVTSPCVGHAEPHATR